MMLLDLILIKIVIGSLWEKGLNIVIITIFQGILRMYILKKKSKKLGEI